MKYLGLRGVKPLTIAKRTVKEFDEDDMSTYAAALAFRALLSLFPFLLFLTATLTFFNMPEFFGWLRQQAALALPPMVVEMINPIIDQLQEDDNSVLSVSIVLAIWVSATGMRSLMNAMNNAYDVRESRPAWKLFPLSILYTLGIALMLIAAAGLMLLGPTTLQWLANTVGMSGLADLSWDWLRWPVVVLLLMFVVAMIYYVTPNARIGACRDRLGGGLVGLRSVCAQLRQLSAVLWQHRRGHHSASVLLHFSVCTAVRRRAQRGN